MKYQSFSLLILLSVISSPVSLFADWRSWGKDQSRNMVSDETGITFDFETGVLNDDESIDLSTTKNIRWVAKLGSQAYGNVTIGEGKVLVGTNNESNRIHQKKGDRGVVMCFDEKTGNLNGN